MTNTTALSAADLLERTESVEIHAGVDGRRIVTLVHAGERVKLFFDTREWTQTTGDGDPPVVQKFADATGDTLDLSWDEWNSTVRPRWNDQQHPLDVRQKDEDAARAESKAGVEFPEVGDGPRFLRFAVRDSRDTFARLAEDGCITVAFPTRTSSKVGYTVREVSPNRLATLANNWSYSEVDAEEYQDAVDTTIDLDTEDVDFVRAREMERDRHGSAGGRDA